MWLFRQGALISRPTTIDKGLWNALITDEETQRTNRPAHTLGILERLVGAISAWTGSYEITGGWLVFKVAAKWESWNNIVKFPEDKIPEDNILVANAGHPATPPPWQKRLHDRRRCSEVILMRFLIGTLTNILIGTGAAYVGKFIVPWLLATAQELIPKASCCWLL